MGGRQMGDRPVDAAHGDQPRIALCMENSTVITPMAASVTIRKFRWLIRHFAAMEPDRQGGDNSRDAVAGDDHTALYRREPRLWA